MPDNISFQVSWSPKADDAVAKLGALCGTIAELTQFMSALSALQKRLRSDPLNFGEVYRKRGNVEEHLAVQEAISVDIAIDSKLKVVYVRNCQRLSRRDG
jgi:hypothetical protein